MCIGALWVGTQGGINYARTWKDASNIRYLDPFLVFNYLALEVSSHVRA